MEPPEFFWNSGLFLCFLRVGVGINLELAWGDEAQKVDGLGDMVEAAAGADGALQALAAADTGCECLLHLELFGCGGAGLFPRLFGLHWLCSPFWGDAGY